MYLKKSFILLSFCFEWREILSEHVNKERKKDINRNNYIIVISILKKNAIKRIYKICYNSVKTDTFFLSDQLWHYSKFEILRIFKIKFSSSLITIGQINVTHVSMQYSNTRFFITLVTLHCSLNRSYEVKRSIDSTSYFLPNQSHKLHPIYLTFIICYLIKINFVSCSISLR